MKQIVSHPNTAREGTDPRIRDDICPVAYTDFKKVGAYQRRQRRTK